MNSCVSVKIVTCGIFRRERTSIIRILETINLNQKWRSAIEKIHLSWVNLKIVKKKQKFKDCNRSFSKAKTEKCDQNSWNIFDQFDISV